MFDKTNDSRLQKTVVNVQNNFHLGNHRLALKEITAIIFVVHVCNILTVAVVDPGRDPAVGVEKCFSSLAPAGMRVLRIGVCVKSVFW